MNPPVSMFLDAMPSNLEFELNDIRIIKMQQLHCAFELTMTDAAIEMLQLPAPLDPEKTVVAIENAITRLRNGEDIECSETFPAATLGVLWGWQIVREFKWKWCAVSQNWWETLAVCDQSEKYVILPVQFMRRIAGETGRIGETDLSPVSKWPRHYMSDIRDGLLPQSVDGKLVCIF